MKVRSSLEFQQVLDSEYAWRKQELTTISLNLKSDRSHKREIWFRTGIVLLYAHWEGLIRLAAEAYLAHLNYKSPAFNQLQPCFLFFAVKSVHTSGNVNLNNFSLFQKTQNLFIEPIRSKFNVDPKAYISTRENQNLNSSEFKSIILKLGIEYLPQYELSEKLLDEKLLNYRNTVAHGGSLKELVSDPLESFELLMPRILRALESFRDQLTEAIKSESYLIRGDSSGA